MTGIQSIYLKQCDCYGQKTIFKQVITTQVAGSCRLEGIDVSKEDEVIMTAIISGDVDADKLRQQRVNFYNKSYAFDILIRK